MSIRDLREKQVVVTGAASGIGRATAIAFVRERVKTQKEDIFHG